MLSGRFSHPSYEAVPFETPGRRDEFQLRPLSRPDNFAPPSPPDLRAPRDPADIADAQAQEWLYPSEARLHYGQSDQPPWPPSATRANSNDLSAKPDIGLSKSDRNRIRWKIWQKAANQLWLYELLSAVVSVACFAALVAVLRLSHGREHTKWLYNLLSLNGLIALLSTFMRASMMVGVGASLGQMKWNQYLPLGPYGPRSQKLKNLDAFDQASRGPFGSLALLLTTTRLHFGLIGALITLLTLAFDTFAQEVITIRYAMKSGVSGTTIGHVARSEIYEVYTKSYQETNFVNDVSTIAAEYNGIFNYQNITAPAAQCSTGNCTWPIVPSLAVCGSCTDLTTDLSYTCVDSGSSDEAVGPNCTYTLSEGSGYTFSAGPPNSANPGRLTFAVVGYYISQHYNDSSYAYIDNWLMINASSGSVSATACALWFCVQAYNTSITNGIASQEIVGNWSESTFNASDPISWVNFTSVETIVQTDESLGFYPVTNYSVAGGVLIAFGQNPIFPDGNVTYGFDSSSFYVYSSPEVRSLQSVADYDDWIDRFALGLSNNIRSTGTSITPAETYAGDVLSMVPLVHVRWAWLGFATAMLAASLTFLVACIWQTSSLGASPWKNDSLALLLASVDDEIQRGSANRWKITEEQVSLVAAERGAVFRKVNNFII